MALKRLQTIESKMSKDEDFAVWYKGKIKEYVVKSYARKLTEDEAARMEAHTWYLPHFAVRNINKGNKLRLVFDAASYSNSESLNSRLMKGPNAYQPRPLLAVLFKFRQAKVGVCADICEMFHRINIQADDQTAQRFLWRDGDLSKPPDIYIMSAMIFGSASSPCSAQYVKNLNAELFRSEYPRAVEAITERHYVDDYVDSFDTSAEAIRVAKEVVSIHRHAGFELRGFVSNSTNFCQAITGDSPSPSATLESTYVSY